MPRSIHEAAYALAAEKYKQAQLSVVDALSAELPSATIDELHHTGQRALELHVAALAFSERVWARSISYELAEEALTGKFPEFPRQVVCGALGASYQATR